MAQSASQSGENFVGPTKGRPRRKPVNLKIEAPSRYLLQDLTKTLHDHDQYPSSGKIRHEFNLQYSMTVSILPRRGKPNGGPGVVSPLYTPNVIWNPFTNTAVGSGSFAFSMQQTQFLVPDDARSSHFPFGLL